MPPSVSCWQWSRSSPCSMSGLTWRQTSWPGARPAASSAPWTSFLFVLMLVEILHTVRVSIRSGNLNAEPFLIVGLIASIRRVLVITLQSSNAQQQEGADHSAVFRTQHDRAGGAGSSHHHNGAVDLHDQTVGTKNRRPIGRRGVKLRSTLRPGGIAPPGQPRNDQLWLSVLAMVRCSCTAGIVCSAKDFRSASLAALGLALQQFQHRLMVLRPAPSDTPCRIWRHPATIIYQAASGPWHPVPGVPSHPSARPGWRAACYWRLWSVTILSANSLTLESCDFCWASWAA